MTRFFEAWLPVTAYVALIFALSSLPNLSPPGDVRHSDKIAHAVEYGMLGLLMARAVGGGDRRLGVRALAIAVVMGAAVAAGDEWFQGTVGRVTSLGDWITDVAAVLIAVWVWRRQWQK